jgi:hypothetical protein
MLILIRTHYVDARVADFSRRLESEAGADVRLLMDETHGPVPCVPLRKISITYEKIQELQLPITSDVTWRCGDYGLYIARQECPEVNAIWMIEYDVRINFDHLGRFFSVFEDERVDFCATHFRPASPDWAWRRTLPTSPLHTNACFLSSTYRRMR